MDWLIRPEQRKKKPNESRLWFSSSPSSKSRHPLGFIFLPGKDSVEVSLYNILQFVVIGTVAGFLGGFLGVGGGIVIIPLLRYWAFPSMNISPEVIVHLSFGTSLAIIIPTSLSGSFAHSKMGNVLWRVVMPLVLVGIPGSLLGSSLAAYLQGPLLI
jgi:uncharacterized membrane protein YfcA